MTIHEMNVCIEKMRKCYKFNDYTTAIEFEPNFLGCEKNASVTVYTRDQNGTEIKTTKKVDHTE